MSHIHDNNDSNSNTLGVSILEARETPTEHLQTAEQLARNIAATLEFRTVGNAVFGVLPSGYSQCELSEQIEKTNPAPNRKRGTAHLGDLPSLLAYCADQAQQAQGYIYANPDIRTITAVFNDGRAENTPGWRDHRAHFAAQFTPEFALWMKKNAQQMSQQEFAEFIEDNFTDMSGGDAQTLLTVATTIQSTSGINFASARRLQDGQTQLTYNEVIDTKAGTDGSLKIPQTFALGLRIFKNGEGYKLTARLKYRLAGGSVKFWYELERPERAVEDAFAGYVQKVRDESGYTVLIGQP